MKISEKWLREWVNPDLPLPAIASCLTMAGFEVESVQPVAGEFFGIQVAQVLSVEKHPQADRLQVCSVDAGEDAPFTVVCGAQCFYWHENSFCTYWCNSPERDKNQKGSAARCELIGHALFCG